MGLCCLVSVSSESQSLSSLPVRCPSPAPAFHPARSRPPGPSAARELGQRFPFIPPKPERTLDYFSCETAPFSINSLCWRDLHPCRSWASASPGGSSLSQGFGAPSADSGLLGPNKRVEKGLSRGGRAPHLPTRRSYCSDVVPSGWRAGFPLRAMCTATRC